MNQETSEQSPSRKPTTLLLLMFVTTIILVMQTYNQEEVAMSGIASVKLDESDPVTDLSVVDARVLVQPKIHSKSENQKQNIKPTNAPTSYPISSTPGVPDVLQQIREARIKPPQRCSNSIHHLLPIIPFDHNWAPYYFRCNELNHPPKSEKRPWIDEGIITKELFYDHVFKAGGSTIQGNIRRFLNHGMFHNFTQIGPDVVIKGGEFRKNSKRPNGKYSQHSILDNFLDNNTITFSFVRDPVDKFLSAFHEVNYRIFDSSQIHNMDYLTRKYGNKTGIEIMRLWIDEMEHRVAMDKTPMNRKPYFLNAHLLPNMVFLVGQHYKTSIPFNFIGNLKHFADDFPQIIEPFIVDEELRRNRTKIQDLIARKNGPRDRTVTLRRFRIERSQLSDDDIRRICKLYWLDYMCFPFDIPVQCDFNGLIQKHYGVNVEYKDCY